MALSLEASWYWPFGSSEEGAKQEEKEPPRLSELMEPATMHIENAFDFAAEGKTKEAIEEYRKALAELDKIEEAEPERSQTPEFASLRTKRAYVTQAIESLLLNEVQQNAKAVAVTDTTELEKKLMEEIEAKRKLEEEKTKAKQEAKTKKPEATDKKPVAKAKVKKPEAKVKKPEATAKGKAKKPETKPKKQEAKVKGKARKPEAKTPAEKIMTLIQERRFEDADKEIEKMLSSKPHSEVALNLRAKNEIERGDLNAAESALDQAIQSNPQSYFAYYNMVQLVLKKNPENKVRARRYYETGRAVGGPKDENLEKLFK